MDAVEIVVRGFALALSSLTALAGWMSGLTLRGRAEKELEKADLCRRLNVRDQAARHDHRAREHILREAIQGERHLIAPLSGADVNAVVMALGIVLIAVGPHRDALALPLALLLYGAMVALMGYESRTVEQAATSRAAVYALDAPSCDTTVPSRRLLPNVFRGRG